MLLSGQNAQGHAPALGGVPGSNGDAVQIQRGGGCAVGILLLLQRFQLLQSGLQIHSGVSFRSLTPVHRCHDGSIAYFLRRRKKRQGPRLAFPGSLWYHILQFTVRKCELS